MPGFASDEMELYIIRRVIVSMITPRDTRRYIDATGVDYGQDVVMPDYIDTSRCSEFFGIRCPHNIHVKGGRIAHVDRADPRHDPIGHLKKDVGVPYAAMAAAAGTVIGAIVTRNRKSGAVVGSLVGLGLGAMVDIAIHYKDSRRSRA